MEKILITETELSELTGISIKTLQWYRFKGPKYAPKFMKIGKRIYYSKEEINEWIKNQPRYQSTADRKDSG
tara:strand:- start:219 stop:431 length:213 start_codon:yes stop_codon:yes gene_type:complete